MADVTYTGPGAVDSYGSAPAPVAQPAESHWYSGLTDTYNNYMGLAADDLKAMLAWRDAKEDAILLSYANSDTGMAVDSALAKAQTLNDVAADTAKKWGGYVSDPGNIQQTLDSVKWVLIAGGLLYGLYVFTPLIRTVRT